MSRNFNAEKKQTCNQDFGLHIQMRLRKLNQGPEQGEKKMSQTQGGHPANNELNSKLYFLVFEHTQKRSEEKSYLILTIESETLQNSKMYVLKMGQDNGLSF